jgi:hypothetical protein
MSIDLDFSSEHVNQSFPLQIFRKISKAFPLPCKSLIAVGILFALQDGSMIVAENVIIIYRRG